MRSSGSPKAASYAGRRRRSLARSRPPHFGRHMRSLRAAACLERLFWMDSAPTGRTELHPMMSFVRLDDNLSPPQAKGPLLKTERFRRAHRSSFNEMPNPSIAMPWHSVSKAKMSAIVIGMAKGHAKAIQNPPNTATHPEHKNQLAPSSGDAVRPIQIRAAAQANMREQT